MDTLTFVFEFLLSILEIPLAFTLTVWLLWIGTDFLLTRNRRKKEPKTSLQSLKCQIAPLIIIWASVSILVPILTLKFFLLNLSGGEAEHVALRLMHGCILGHFFLGILFTTILAIRLAKNGGPNPRSFFVGLAASLALSSLPQLVFIAIALWRFNDPSRLPSAFDPNSELWVPDFHVASALAHAQSVLRSLVPFEMLAFALATFYLAFFRSRLVALISQFLTLLVASISISWIFSTPHSTLTITYGPTIIDPTPMISWLAPALIVAALTLLTLAFTHYLQAKRLSPSL